MTKLLLFDFDGTIIDSLPFFKKQVNILAKKHNFRELSHQELEQIRDRGAREILKEMHIPLWKLPFIAKDYKSAFQKTFLTTPLIPGIKEAFVALSSRNFKLVIVSSNATPTIQQYLNDHNISGIDAVYGDIGMFGKGKKILDVIREQNVSKQAAIYIGDEVRDIEAAKKAGVRTIAVTWGYTTANRLAQSHPDYLVSSPKELISTLPTQ